MPRHRLPERSTSRRRAGGSFGLRVARREAGESVVTVLSETTARRHGVGAHERVARRRRPLHRAAVLVGVRRVDDFLTPTAAVQRPARRTRPCRVERIGLARAWVWFEVDHAPRGSSAAIRARQASVISARTLRGDVVEDPVAECQP